MTSYEERDFKIFPDFLVCPNFGFKPSKLQNYNLTSSEVRNYVSKFDQMFEKYKELSFLLNRDFTVSFETNVSYILYEGQNLIEGQNLEILSIDTPHNGICLYIKTSQWNGTNGKIRFELNKNLTLEDFQALKSLKLILTTENGWQDFHLQEFEYFKPEFHYLEFVENSRNFYILAMSMEETLHQIGIEDRRECFTNFIQGD